MPPPLLISLLLCFVPACLAIYFVFHWFYPRTLKKKLYLACVFLRQTDGTTRQAHTLVWGYEHDYWQRVQTVTEFWRSKAIAELDKYNALPWYVVTEEDITWLPALDVGTARTELR